LILIAGSIGNDQATTTTTPFAILAKGRADGPLILAADPRGDDGCFRDIATIP
jgi:hypothetical protein